MTTFTDQLAELVAYLDDRLESLGGYSLSVTHYDFQVGKHELKVTAFPHTIEGAQDASTSLNLNFTQDDEYLPRYIGRRNGIEYAFHINVNDPSGNPARFTPGGAS